MKIISEYFQRKRPAEDYFPTFFFAGLMIGVLIGCASIIFFG